MKLAVVILAAGQGKRMKSALPKVLQPLAGRPLLRHVVSRARLLEPASIHVVYGHGGEQVRAALDDADLQWALQAEQLGTGHALMQAMPQVADDALVLVLYGDVPLVDAQTLRQLIGFAGPKSMGLLTVMLQDPAGYGRIVRKRGAIQKIVEQKDANRAQLKIREGNSGIMAAPAKLLRRWLGKLKNANAQGEYYLTDIIAMAVREKVKVTPLISPTMAQTLGVNDKVQLAELEALYRAERARELMLAGVTLADPARIDVRGEVSVGRDVFVDANVLFEGKVTLGDNVRIGANVVLRDVSVAAGTVIHPNSILEQSEVGTDNAIGPFARVRPGYQDRPWRPRRQFRRAQEDRDRRRQQGQPPHVPRRCHHRQGRERGRGHHHLQLRRREQVADHHRGRCVHRLRQHAGGAGAHRQGRHHRRGQHHHQGCAGRTALTGPRQTGGAGRLETSREEIQRMRQS